MLGRVRTSRSMFSAWAEDSWYTTRRAAARGPKLGIYLNPRLRLRRQVRLGSPVHLCHQFPAQSPRCRAHGRVARAGC